MKLLRFIVCIVVTLVGFGVSVSAQANDACAEITADNFIPDADCLAMMKAFQLTIMVTPFCCRVVLLPASALIPMIVSSGKVRCSRLS